MAGAGEGSLVHYFWRGAEIEISSDDPGFRGSWYAGTVIRPPKDDSSTSRVYVEYKNLTNKSGTRRLRELLKVVQLRPRQPRENRRAFEFSDEVDAYYNDGWWEGVITKILEEAEEDEYMVFFRGTREQLPFKVSELRLHREWVDGGWIPPLDPSSSADIVPVGRGRTPSSAEAEANEEVSEHIYNPGDLVEVSSDEEGLEGALLAASVLEITTAGKYIIQYKDLKDEDDIGFLKEEVDGLHLRPCPPDVGLVDRFVLNEEVDAWFNDCWWVGVIWKVLKREKYMVFFKNTDEVIRFDHSDLRVHQEWRNGKWHISSKVLK